MGATREARSSWGSSVLEVWEEERFKLSVVVESPWMFHLRSGTIQAPHYCILPLSFSHPHPSTPLPSPPPTHTHAPLTYHHRWHFPRAREGGCPWTATSPGLPALQHRPQHRPAAKRLQWQRPLLPQQHSRQTLLWKSGSWKRNQPQTMLRVWHDSLY